MTDLLMIIDKIIEDHKVILADLQTLENVANDAGALMAMEKTKDSFMPGRPSPTSGLHKLDEMRNKVATGLEAHFNREETALLDAFREYGQMELVESLKVLLQQHTQIRSDLSEFKGQLGELMTENLSRNLWETKGYDIRARINQLHKTMASHAAEEQTLLHKIQQDVKNRSI